MITVENLTKRYERRVVVDGLSFEVKPGVVTGFLGPNGAGKSTTMRMMLGLTHPDSGHTWIGGAAYRDLQRPLRQVGALMESSIPARQMTAIGHLLWLTHSNGISVSRPYEVLQAVGLADVAHQRTSGFSLGMRQRLGLAAALLGDPQVLILDEPVNGLDAEGIRWLRNLLLSMAADGRTILLSSHLMAEISLVADHLIVINRGRLLADTGREEFMARYGHTFVRVKTADVLALTTVLQHQGVTVRSSQDGVLEVTGTTAETVSHLAAHNGLRLSELSTHTGSLEEIFLGAVAEEDHHA